MNPMKRPCPLLTFMLAGAWLAGCASVTDVTPNGSGGYMVSAHGIDGNGSAGEQKAIALRKASDYCNAKALQMELVDSTLTDPKFGAAPAAIINFRCKTP